MKISFNDMCSALTKADDIVILTHRRPDGDTLGSAAALCLGLRQLGKKAYLLYNPDITPRFAPMVQELWMPDGFIAGCVCSVDVADTSLLCGNAPERIDLAIDHHSSFKDFAAAGYCDHTAAACGEIIYRMLMAMGCCMTKPMADAIYTAVATDTGCFCFANTTAHAHKVAVACFEAGADWEEINYRCFRLKSKARVALEGHIYSTMELCSGGRAAVSAVTRDDIAAFGAADDDLENLSSLLTQIEGVEIGALLTESLSRNLFKVSMRSRGHNVSEICAAFGGGGHAGAAGCTLKDMTVQEATQAIMSALEEKTNA